MGATGIMGATSGGDVDRPQREIKTHLGGLVHAPCTTSAIFPATKSDIIPAKLAQFVTHCPRTGFYDPSTGPVPTRRFGNPRATSARSRPAGPPKKSFKASADLGEPGPDHGWFQTAICLVMWNWRGGADRLSRSPDCFIRQAALLRWAAVSRCAFPVSLSSRRHPGCCSRNRDTDAFLASQADFPLPLQGTLPHGNHRDGAVGVTNGVSVFLISAAPGRESMRGGARPSQPFDSNYGEN